MARVNSLDEDSILALFEAKREEDNAAYGSKGATETNTANVTAQGLIIAQHQSDIAAAQASIASLGTTVSTHSTQISDHATTIQSLKPHWISANSSGSTSGGTPSNVGVLSLTKGSDIFTTGESTLTSKLAGIFIWHALFYMPTSVNWRRGWASPPNELSGSVQSSLGADDPADRFTLTSVSRFATSGLTLQFAQQSPNSVGTTFAIRGIFIPGFFDLA